MSHDSRESEDDFGSDPSVEYNRTITRLRSDNEKRAVVIGTLRTQIAEHKKQQANYEALLNATEEEITRLNSQLAELRKALEYIAKITDTFSDAKQGVCVAAATAHNALLQLKRREALNSGEPPTASHLMETKAQEMAQRIKELREHSGEQKEPSAVGKGVSHSE
jgi:uncharacterized protein involved in exopolysaccharide biosynthesis